MQSGQRIVRGYGLYEQLREYKPTSVIAFDGDAGETKINVPDIRNKHARVMTTLKEIAWVRVDLLDKKGGLLYRHHRNADDRDAPAGELEELPPTRAVAEMQGIATIISNAVLRGQETVLVHTQRSTAAAQEALMRVVESSLRRLELQEQQIEHAMRLNWQLSTDLVNAQLAQLQIPASVGDDGEPRPRSDAAMDALMPHIIRSALGGDKAPKPMTSEPAKPKNGHANGTTPKKSPPQERPAPSSPTE